MIDVSHILICIPLAIVPSRDLNCQLGHVTVVVAVNNTRGTHYIYIQ